MSVPAYLLMVVAGGCVVLGPGVALVLWGVRKVREAGLRNWIAVVACACSIAMGCAVIFIAVSFVLDAREFIYRIKLSEMLAGEFLQVSVVLLVAMIVSSVVSGSTLIACLVRKIASWKLFLAAEAVVSMVYAAILFRLVMVY